MNEIFRDDQFRVTRARLFDAFLAGRAVIRESYRCGARLSDPAAKIFWHF